MNDLMIDGFRQAPWSLSPEIFQILLQIGAAIALLSWLVLIASPFIFFGMLLKDANNKAKLKNIALK